MVSEEGTMLAMEEAVVSEGDVLAMLELGARLWRGVYSDPQVARLGMGRLLHAIGRMLGAYCLSCAICVPVDVRNRGDSQK